MREHLYQGKRKDNGEWVQGDLIHRQIWASSLCVIRESDDGFDHYEEYEVDPETVSEFTGLRDGNGKRIFEGDIVKVDLIGGGERISEVGIGECFDTDGETIFGIFGKCDEGNLIIPISEEYAALYEVIGNKWDNPELLEGKT